MDADEAKEFIPQVENTEEYQKLEDFFTADDKMYGDRDYEPSLDDVDPYSASEPYKDGFVASWLLNDRPEERQGDFEEVSMSISFYVDDGEVDVDMANGAVTYYEDGEPERTEYAEIDEEGEIQFTVA